MTLIDVVKQASNQADGITTRSPYAVLAAAQAELGETAQEVAVLSGDSYKAPGVDGVIGESIDTICALLDLIHVIDPTLTEDDLIRIATPKLNKWLTKVTEHKKK